MDFIVIHDEEHNFLDGLIDIPFNSTAYSLPAINKAYIEISLQVPITTVSKPNLLGFLYQEFNDKRSKPYPIISQQQSITLDFSNCDSFIFVPTNRLIDDYVLRLYVANDSASNNNGNGQTVDLTNYVTESELSTVLNDYALAVSIPYQHNHSISEITGLNTVLDDHESRLDELEANSGNGNSNGNNSSELIKLTANATLESNKPYYFASSNLMMSLPNNPNIGDYLRLYNSNVSTRINHGNANQKITNNTTDTPIGIDNGIVLKPYSFIELLYVGNDLWVSTNRIRTINNYSSSPIISNIGTKKSYTATTNMAASFSTNASLIYNGIKEPTGSFSTDGLLTSSGGNLFITINNNESIILSEVKVWTGQGNLTKGNPSQYQLPFMNIYSGNTADAANKIGDTLSFDNLTGIEQSKMINTTVESSSYTFECYGASNIGILEIEIFGKTYVQGEIPIV